MSQVHFKLNRTGGEAVRFALENADSSTLYHRANSKLAAYGVNLAKLAYRNPEGKLVGLANNEDLKKALRVHDNKLELFEKAKKTKKDGRRSSSSSSSGDNAGRAK